MKNQSINLPDSPKNSISDADIKKGEFRITVSSKEFFDRNHKSPQITINTLVIEASYTAREGRSDILRIGKQAMEDLKLKPGGRIKITKKGVNQYSISRF